ncbi:hypothetical protein KM043_016438 [Ampulex compressa]|nr:hypothetical protein KM043_016438 [Ampulex compressa]
MEQGNERLIAEGYPRNEGEAGGTAWEEKEPEKARCDGEGGGRPRADRPKERTIKSRWGDESGRKGREGGEETEASATPRGAKPSTEGRETDPWGGKGNLNFRDCGGGPVQIPIRATENKGKEELLARGSGPFLRRDACR